MSGTKLTKDDEAGAAYGSLYMNQGEKIGKAKEQIIKVSEQQPVVWFFDIVCTANQMPAAKEWATYLTGYIKGANEAMPEENIVIGVTTKDDDRPAWHMLGQLTAGLNGPMTEVAELKTGRRYMYVGGKLKT